MLANLPFAVDITPLAVAVTALVMASICVDWAAVLVVKACSTLWLISASLSLYLAMIWLAVSCGLDTNFEVGLAIVLGSCSYPELFGTRMHL